MKTHLFRPNDDMTMCGIQIKSFSTTDPMAVECSRCFAMYVTNVEWYWHMLGKPTPPGARYLNVDIPFPGLYLAMHRGVFTYV